MAVAPYKRPDYRAHLKRIEFAHGRDQAVRIARRWLSTAPTPPKGNA